MHMHACFLFIHRSDNNALTSVFSFVWWRMVQVSCTVTFDAAREGDQIAHALDYFQYQLKGVSFLPLQNHSYKHMPYEEISEEQYKQMMANIKPIDWKRLTQTHEPNEESEKFCNGGACNVQL